MALARPWLVWIIGTVVLLALFWLFAYGWGWPPYLDSCIKDGSCYCEKFDLAALQSAERAGTWWKGVQQPVNTYSNFYAIVSAGYVACRMWRDRQLATAPNVMMSKWWMGDVWVFCVLFLGLGSMWFHGSMSSSVSWFDGFSMYVFAGFLVYYTLDRGFIRRGVTPQTRTLVFWIGYPLTVIVFTALGAAGIKSELLIGILVLQYILFELFLAKFVFYAKAQFDWAALWLWIGGLASFGLAELFRALSTHDGSAGHTKDAMCFPDSWFQPHGLLWHTLAGVMALCLYFYWRRDTNGVGSLPPGYQ
jgi:hypothetical protein